MVTSWKNACVSRMASSWCFLAIVSVVFNGKLMKKLITFTWSRSSIVHHWFITVTSLDSGRVTNSSGRWTVRSWKKGTCESMPNLFVGGFLMRQGEVGPNERVPLFLFCSYYFCWRYQNESNPLWLVKDFKSSSVRVQAQAQQHPPASAKACFRKCSLATQSNLSDLRHL